MAILASFTYTWYNYFIKTFQQQASDVLLVKATSSLVIFGSLVLFQKQDVWPQIERCESVRQYWLQGFLLIFQVRNIQAILYFTYSKFTVWKFHDFSTTQILLEINFGDSRSAKSAIITHLKALDFDFYDLCTF